MTGPRKRCPTCGHAVPRTPEEHHKIKLARDRQYRKDNRDKCLAYARWYYQNVTKPKKSA